MKRFCIRCLFYEGMRFWLHPKTLPDNVLPVTLDEQGVCSVCRAYAKAYNSDLGAMNVNHLKLSRDAPAIVLYSGGKDSTAMLAYARRELGLDVTALLFDNGLIPANVMARAEVVCERLDVDLHIVTRADLPNTLGLLSVAEEIERVSEDRLTPCVTCAGHIMAGAYELGRRLRSTWLLQGTNYFSYWHDVPVAMRMTTVAGYTMRALHLPYALGWTRNDTRQQLANVGFEELELQGVSSNCVVPALVQASISRRIGHVPELEDLSLEVLVGHVSRNEALDELERKAPKLVDLIADAR